MININDKSKSDGSPEPESIQATYNEQAATYDQSRLKTAFQRRFDAAERSVIRRHLPNLKTALEVGVGTGRLTNELLAKAETVTAVDISENMLVEVRKKYPQARNLELRCVNAHELSQIPGYGAFDAVMSFRMLPHIDNIVELLRLLRNAARPGGIIIADFWNPISYTYWKKRGSSVYNHYVTYREALIMLRNSGLELTVVEGANFQNPLNVNLELLGRTPLKRFGYSLIAICRRPCEHGR